MRVEFMTEIPTEVTKGKYIGHLNNLLTGEDKCVVFSFDSDKEVNTAHNSIRATIKRKYDGMLCVKKNTNQIYVYKV